MGVPQGAQEVLLKLRTTQSSSAVRGVDNARKGSLFFLFLLFYFCEVPVVSTKYSLQY